MSRIFIIHQVCRTMPHIRLHAKTCVLKALSMRQDPRILPAEWVIWWVVLFIRFSAFTLLWIGLASILRFHSHSLILLGEAFCSRLVVGWSMWTRRGFASTFTRMRVLGRTNTLTSANIAIDFSCEFYWQLSSIRFDADDFLCQVDNQLWLNFVLWQLQNIC
jgi:hypothetical protein